MSDRLHRGIQEDVLDRIRNGRSDLHISLGLSGGNRERVFAPARLLPAIHEHIARISTGTQRERCGKLFTLAVLLYGALDWHFAGSGIDVEADVQLERMRQDDRHGGTDADDRLSNEDWRSRLTKQASRLEQERSCEKSYSARLVKLTALAQAALEAAHRQPDHR